MEFDLLSRLRSAARLDVLAKTGMMDSPPDERIDRYTKLAAQMLDAPTSLVSLVDDRRQFFKSAYGLAEPWATLRETPLSFSFCKYAVASGKPLIVDDATQHPLVRDSAAVAESGVQAYAGMPLEVHGEHVGALCVVDGRARSWSERELEILRSLADAVATELELAATKRELAQQARLVGSLTDSVLDAVITMGEDGRIVFCNRATETMFMRSRAELIDSDVSSLMPERYREGHRTGVTRLRGGSPPRVLGRVVEVHGLRADGTEFPIELSLSRFTGHGVTLITAVLRDVTERTRTTQALQEAEEELRLTVQHAPIGIALVGPEGRWLRVNDALCRIVGYTREELLAIDFQKITHPDDLHSDLAHLERLLSGKVQNYEMDKRYIHRAGHVVWIHLSVSLVRASSGEPRFFVSQIEDITARRTAEAEASLFFDHSIDMLAITGESGRLDRVNRAWESALGWSREEITSRDFIEFVHPDDRERTASEAATLYGGVPSVRFRNRYLAKSGAYHWLEWASHRTSDGRLFCVARDISQQVERERELRLWMRVLESVSNGVLITKPQLGKDQIIYVNPAFERMTGYSQAELVGERCRILQGTDREQPELEVIREALRSEQECQVVLRNYRKGGELFLNSLTISPVRDESGRVSHYVGISEDITSRVASEQAAAKQSAIMSAVLESMNDGVFVADRDGQVLLYNEVTRRLFEQHPVSGTPSEWGTAYGLFLPDQVTPCPPEEVPMARALRGQSVDQFELWVRLPGLSDGRWHSVTANPVRDREGRLLGGVTVSRDITSRKVMEERVRRASLTDELTGLYNRRGFMLMAEQQMRIAQRHGEGVGVLFIDLDGMKRINDEQGHDAGDDALVDTATLLTRTCRATDVIARLGGDEFVVLALGGSDSAQALRSRLDAALVDHNERRSPRYPLAFSIGLATSQRTQPSELGQLLAEADSAMYEVKRARRG